MPEVRSIASVNAGEGLITLMAIGDGGNGPDVWWLAQDTPGQAGWSGDWQSVGVPTPGLPRTPVRVSVARDGRNRPAAVVCGGDHAIWFTRQEKPNGSWSAWRTLDFPGVVGTNRPSDPTLVLDGDNRLAVFVTAADEVWASRQQADPESWAPWEPVGGEVPVMADSAARPTVALLDDRRLEVLAVAGNSLRYVAETAGGGWAHWRRAGAAGSPQPPQVTLDDHFRLVAAEVVTNGHLLANVQLTPGGDWEGWRGFVPPDLQSFQVLGTAFSSHADSRPIFLAPFIDSTGVEKVWIVEGDPHAPDRWRGRTIGPHPIPEFASFARRIEDPVLTLDANGKLIAAFRVPGSTSLYWLQQEEENSDVWLEGVLRAAPPALS